jgi:chromosome segregation ATPase
MACLTILVYTAALSAAEATVRRLEEDLEEKEGQVRLLIDQCHRSDRQVAEVMGERDAAAAALAEETQRATQMQAEFVKATNQV